MNTDWSVDPVLDVEEVVAEGAVGDVVGGAVVVDAASEPPIIRYPVTHNWLRSYLMGEAGLVNYRQKGRFSTCNTMRPCLMGRSYLRFCDNAT